MRKWVFTWSSKNCCLHFQNNSLYKRCNIISRCHITYIIKFTKICRTKIKKRSSLHYSLKQLHHSLKQFNKKIRSYLETDLRDILKPIAAINIDINGESRLKKQYGRYSRVATFRTVAWVIPQEFQGMRTDTTVAESSTDRLRSLLSYPLSW